MNKNEFRATRSRIFVPIASGVLLSAMPLIAAVVILIKYGQFITVIMKLAVIGCSLLTFIYFLTETIKLVLKMPNMIVLSQDNLQVHFLLNRISIPCDKIVKCEHVYYSHTPKLNLSYVIIHSIEPARKIAFSSRLFQRRFEELKDCLVNMKSLDRE